MKTFELSKEIIQEISNLISNKENKEIKKLVDGIHYADLAEIINELESKQRIYLIKIIICYFFKFYFICFIGLVP